MTDIQNYPIDDTEDQYALESDVNLYNSLMGNVSAQNIFAWRVATVNKLAPWLANTGRADYPTLIAQENIPDNQLGDMAAQMWGMYQGEQIAKTLKLQNPSVQRSVFSQLSYGQQQTLLASGYKVPQPSTHSASRASEIIGNLVSPSRWALSDAIVPAGSAAIHGLIFAQDQIVNRQIRTLLQQSGGNKAASAVGGVAAAATVGTGIVAALGMTNPLTVIPTLGLTALAGATVTSFAYEALSGNSEKWIQSWVRAGDGEKLFRPEAVRQVEQKLNNPELQALVSRVAAELDTPEELMMVIREVASSRELNPSKPDPSKQYEKLKNLAADVYDEGTVEYQNYLKGLIEIIFTPAVQEAIVTLQSNKYSIGREFARGIGLDPGSSAYFYVSGSVDGVSVFLLDPMNLIGPVVKTTQAARRGLEYGNTAQQAARFRQIAERPEVRRVFDQVARSVETGRVEIMQRYAKQWLPLYDDMRAYARAQKMSFFDANDVVEFIVGHGQLKAIQEGIGVVPGTSKMIIKKLGPVGFALRKTTGEIGDFFRAAGDLSLERLVEKINKSPDAFVKMLSEIPMRDATGSVLPTLEIFGDMGLLPDALAEAVFQQAKTSRGYMAGRAVGKAIAPLPGFSQLFRGIGGFVDGLTLAVPRGKAIYIVENSERTEDIIAFVDMFRTTGMPTYVRNLWKHAIFDAPDFRTRINAINSFFESAAEAGGLGLTERGRDMIDNFLYHYKQHFAIGKANVTTHGLNDIAVGVRPVADMAQMIVIPNLQEIRAAMKDGTLLRWFAGIPEDTVLLANATRIWKPAVLFRFGFALRNIGEDVLAMLARYGSGHFIQEVAARSVGKQSAYLSLVQDIEKTDELFKSGKAAARQLTSSERFILENYRYPVGTKTFRRAMERLGPVGDIGLLLLRDATSWARNFVSPGMAVGRVRRGAAELESIMAKWNDISDVELLQRMAPKFLRENIKYTTNVLAWGNPTSVRRMLAGGISAQQLKIGQLWAEKHVFSIMQRLGTAPGYGMDLTGRELSLVERMMGPSSTPHTTIYGERAVVPFGTVSDLVEDSHIALHSNMVGLVDDPVIRSALPELGNILDDTLRSSLSSEVLAKTIEPWHNLILWNSKMKALRSGNDELIHLFLVLNERNMNPSRFNGAKRAFLAKWSGDENDAIQSLVRLLNDPAFTGAKTKDVDLFLYRINGHAYEPALRSVYRELQSIDDVHAQDWLLQQIGRDFFTSGNHFEDILGRPTTNGVLYRGVTHPDQYEILPDGSLQLTLYRQNHWDALDRNAVSFTASYDQASLYATNGLLSGVSQRGEGQIIAVDIDSILSAFGLSRSDVLRGSGISYTSLPYKFYEIYGPQYGDPAATFLQGWPSLYGTSEGRGAAHTEIAFSKRKPEVKFDTPKRGYDPRLLNGTISVDSIRPSEFTIFADDEFVAAFDDVIKRFKTARQQIIDSGEKIDNWFFPDYEKQYRLVGLFKTPDRWEVITNNEHRVLDYFAHSGFRTPSGTLNYFSPEMWDFYDADTQLNILNQMIDGVETGPVLPSSLPLIESISGDVDHIVLPPGSFEIRRLFNEAIAPDQYILGSLGIEDISNKFFRTIEDARDAMAMRMATEMQSGNWDYYLNQSRKFDPKYENVEDVFVVDLSKLPPWTQQMDSLVNTPEYPLGERFKALSNVTQSDTEPLNRLVLDALDQQLPLVFDNERVASTVRDYLNTVLKELDPYKFTPDTISLSSSAVVDSIDYIVPPVRKTFLPIQPGNDIQAEYDAALAATQAGEIPAARRGYTSEWKFDDNDVVPYSVIGWDSSKHPFITDYLNDAPIAAQNERIINDALDLVEQIMRPGFEQQWVARRSLWYEFEGNMIEIPPGQIIPNAGTLYTAPQAIEANALESLDDLRYMEPLPDPFLDEVFTYAGQQVHWDAALPLLYDEAEDLSGRHIVAAKEWYLDPSQPFARLGDSLVDVAPDGDALVASTVRVPRFTVRDVRRIDAVDLPNVVIAKRRALEPITAGDKIMDLFQRGTNWAFNNILGPIMDTIARRPMAYHAFSLNFERVMRTSSWLTDQTQDFRDVETLISRLISKQLYKKADSKTASVIAEAGRAFAKTQDVAEAEFFTAGQAFAYLRGTQRSTTVEGFKDILETTIQQHADLLSPKEIAALRFAMNKSSTFDSIALEFGNPSEFLDEIKAFVSSNDLDQILRTGRAPKIADDTPSDVKRILEEITDDEWKAIAGYAQKRERLYEQAANIAEEATFRDVMPFVDSHEMRSHVADWGRGFMPFWYAEENFLKRWGKILAMDSGTNTLSTLRKAYLTYTGMRHMGVIKRDAQGKDWFIMPGSELFIESLAKISGLESDGRSFVLKMPTDRMLPGIGGDFGRPSFSPMVMMPIDFIHGLFPEFDPLTDIERGFAGDYGANRKWWAHLVPKQWADLFGGSGIIALPFMNDRDMSMNERIASSANTAMAYLEASGEYDPETNPDGRALSPTASAAELDNYLRDAREWGRVMLFAQKIAGWFAMGPTSADVTLEDGNTLNVVSGGGELDVKSFLAADFFDLISELGIEDGTIAFLQMYSKQNGAVSSRAIFNPLAFTAGSSESVSGAPLPSTDDAIKFYLENQNTFDEYKFAGPWMIPADQSGDVRTSWAFDQTVIAGLRVTRNSNEDFLRELKYKEAAYPYFTKRDEYMVRIAEAKDAGATMEARDLQFAWEYWSKNFRIANPIFAEELTSQKASNRREKIISEMTILIDDPKFPKAPQFESIKILTEAYLKFDREIARLDLNNTALTRDLIKLEKTNFESWATSFVREHPEINSYWVTVIRPEAGLDM